jgi:hypothetical protein
MNGQDFWLDILLAFLVGGGWITLTTVAADRFGTKTGGFIGGLPSTIVVSLLFIGIVQGPATASEVTTFIPLSMAFSGLFLAAYALLARKGFLLGLVLSLLLWFILSSLIIVFRINNFIFAMTGYLILFLFTWLIFTKYLNIHSIGVVRPHFSAGHLILRGLFGGFIIAFTVVISKLGGPVFGGIFGAFPAVFMSTIIISYRSNGLEFSRSITKPLFFSGMINVIVYSTSVRYLYPVYGLLWGTMLSYLISMVSALLTFLFIHKKLI